MLVYLLVLKFKQKLKEGFILLSTSAKMLAPKTAFYILLVYIAFQLSGYLLFLPPIKTFLLQFFELEKIEATIALIAWWNAISSIIAIIVCMILIKKNTSFWQVFKGEKVSIPVSIAWGVIGFFLVFIGQNIGANIEFALGIDYTSTNTETILRITDIAPIMIVSTVFTGPILEELVFRRVIFGSLIQVQNFWIAGLISSIIFAAIHLDFSHILLYSISGFIFAFLYYKTKRLLTSIIAHMMLNGSITLYQLYAEEIQQMLDQLPK